MRTKIILICGAGATVSSSMELARLITEASKLECVEQIHCQIDGQGSYGGREFGYMHIDEAAHIPYTSQSIKDMLADIDEPLLEDYIPKEEPRRYEAPREAPHVHTDTRKPSKSKAKPHRPMIRRTC